MMDLVLPKIEHDVTSHNYGRFVIGPLESGYGLTLGNSLRRVLLSSIPGAAITAVRVNDVPHEFTAIPGVREDMMAFLLQVKQIRLKMYTEEATRLHLDIRGEGPVMAGDIECPSQVEIINPELYLFTVNDPQAELYIEFVAEMGRGYSPAEEREKLPIGELPVDAIFSSVRKASFRVGQARVGQMTNFDQLTMEIWTNGSLKPHEALAQAAKLLVSHLSLIASVDSLVLTDATALGETAALVEEDVIPSQAYEMLIEDLDLSVRVYNCLKRTGITRVGEVLERLEKGSDEMMTIRNFGAKSLEELEAKLKERDFLTPEGQVIKTMAEVPASETR
ncbi:MAG: DNA-directed RNA polymerase subunit alpha [Anaerolineaceae bacterium 4572_32.1]|nr:MAG: DNA-directed RNA polymerase subunit alpha [Anaerolineaceae bacterium 4572_32.1]